MRLLNLAEISSAQVGGLCRRNPPGDEGLMEFCREVFDNVEKRGDDALLEFTLRFDHVQLSSVVVTEDEKESARRGLEQEQIAALRRAAQNIRVFHLRQQCQGPDLEVEPGVRCWRERRPIESVGLYVPGGSTPLPSSALMQAIPAQIAGCPEVVVCTPPRSDGSLAPSVLLAAEMAGVEKIFKVGGIQAIAALARGTESVPRVDKIFGPGSRFVQAAKMLAFSRGTAIDLPAGPSEVMVIADEQACAPLVAADLISQAEHDQHSRAILVSTSQALIDATLSELALQLEDLPRKEVAQLALKGSFCLATQDLSSAFEFANRYAPEHLILHLPKPQRWSKLVQSAGSVFLGPWSPEVAGDYASGTNHTLPTAGSARAFSGLSLSDFQKTISFQQLSHGALESLSETLQTLASMEGLEGHRRAVCKRFEYGESDFESEEEPKKAAKARENTKMMIGDGNGLIRSEILGLVAYESARSKINSGILLDANESPFENRRLDVPLNRYPDPSQRLLRERLAGHLGLKREQVLCGSGSDEILDWVLKVFCRPGEDLVAIAEPSYGMYRVQAQIHGVEHWRFALDDRFDVSASAFLENVPRSAKVAFFCSPNNPTGNCLDLEALLTICREWTGVVVVDEAYAEFARGGSVLGHLGDHPRLIVMRTFSKALGHAGIRLGYAAAPAPLIDHFSRVKAPYNVNGLTQKLGCEALDQWSQVEAGIQLIRSERERLQRRLGQFSRVETVYPSEANFLLVRCPGASRICRLLQQRGVVIRDRSSLRRLQDCFRITIGLPEENDFFLARLTELLGEGN